MNTTKLITVSVLTLASALPGFAMAESTGDATAFTASNSTYQQTLHRDVVLTALKAAVADGTHSFSGDASQAPQLKSAASSTKAMTKMTFNAALHTGDAS